MSNHPTTSTITAGGSSQPALSYALPLTSPYADPGYKPGFLPPPLSPAYQPYASGAGSSYLNQLFTEQPGYSGSRDQPGYAPQREPPDRGWSSGEPETFPPSSISPGPSFLPRPGFPYQSSPVNYRDAAPPAGSSTMYRESPIPHNMGSPGPNYPDGNSRSYDNNQPYQYREPGVAPNARIDSSPLYRPEMDLSDRDDSQSGAYIEDLRTPRPYAEDVNRSRSYEDSVDQRSYNSDSRLSSSDMPMSENVSPNINRSNNSTPHRQYEQSESSQPLPHEVSYTDLSKGRPAGDQINNSGYNNKGTKSGMPANSSKHAAINSEPSYQPKGPTEAETELLLRHVSNIFIAMGLDVPDDVLEIAMLRPIDDADTPIPSYTGDDPVEASKMLIMAINQIVSDQQQCAICGKTFKTIDFLKQHLRRKHSVSEDRALQHVSPPTNLQLTLLASISELLQDEPSTANTLTKLLMTSDDKRQTAGDIALALKQRTTDAQAQRLQAQKAAQKQTTALEQAHMKQRIAAQLQREKPRPRGRPPKNPRPDPPTQALPAQLQAALAKGELPKPLVDIMAKGDTKALKDMMTKLFPLDSDVFPEGMTEHLQDLMNQGDIHTMKQLFAEQTPEPILNLFPDQLPSSLQEKLKNADMEVIRELLLMGFKLPGVPDMFAEDGAGQNSWGSNNHGMDDMCGQGVPLPNLSMASRTAIEELIEQGLSSEPVGEMAGGKKGKKSGLQFCPICLKKFPNTVSMSQHMKTHAGDKSHVCGICNKEFARTSHLNLHMRTHTGERPFECVVCSMKFRQSGELIRHMRTHTGERPYECLECGKFFATTQHRALHMKIHTGDKPFKCSLCDKRFTHNGNLSAHMRTHTGERPYACDICDKTFSESGHLRKHMSVHTGDKPFHCTLCDRQFAHQSQLQIHMKIHMNDKPFKCDICGGRYISAAERKRHYRTHTGEKPYECRYCGKRFIASSNLNRHERTHTGEKPFHCQYCPKKFAQSGNLTSHLRTHTGERPYACMFCPKRFTQSGDLNKHMVKHTGQKINSDTMDILEPRTNAEGRPILTLSDVGPGALKKALLAKKRGPKRKMRKMPNQLECGLCNIGFTDPEKLSIHMLKHAKNAAEVEDVENLAQHRLQCSMCDEWFEGASALAIHMADHSQSNSPQKEKKIEKSEVHFPFKCALCEDRFSDVQTLTTHMEAHGQGGEIIGDSGPQPVKKKKKRVIRKKEKEDDLLMIQSRHGEFQCTVCLAWHEDPDELTKHMVEHAKDIARRAKEAVSKAHEKDVGKANILMTMPVDRKANLPCAICGEIHIDPLLLANHMAGHAIPETEDDQAQDEENMEEIEGEEYMCIICKANHRTANKLALHMREHVFANRADSSFMTQGKRSKKCYQCGVCDKSFSDAYGVSAHMIEHAASSMAADHLKNLVPQNEDTKLDAKMSEETSFQCGMCDGMYDDKQSLTVHMMEHLMETKKNEPSPPKASAAKKRKSQTPVRRSLRPRRKTRKRRISYREVNSGDESCGKNRYIPTPSDSEDSDQEKYNRQYQEEIVTPPSSPEVSNNAQLGEDVHDVDRQVVFDTSYMQQVSPDAPNHNDEQEVDSPEEIDQHDADADLSHEGAAEGMSDVDQEEEDAEEEEPNTSQSERDNRVENLHADATIKIDKPDASEDVPSPGGAKIASPAVKSEVEDDDHPGQD